MWGEEYPYGYTLKNLVGAGKLSPWNPGGKTFKGEAGSMKKKEHFSTKRGTLKFAPKNTGGAERPPLGVYGGDGKKKT